MKNNSGFTIVELMAVIIIFIILTLFTIATIQRNSEQAKIKAFIKEVNTFSKAAMSKQEMERLTNPAADDIFHNAIYGKVCYSITQKDKLSKYIQKSNNNYKGSVEVCYGVDCPYESKIWITDGKHYIDGLSEVKDESQVKDSFSTDYPESCGVDAVGGGNGGDLTSATFDYTGKEEVMYILREGIYSLEVWGGQGGDYAVTNTGGYGSYSYTEVELKRGDLLYVNVGGKGSGRCPTDNDTCRATFNGGSKGGAYCAAGGGATHIATKSGRLYDVPIQYVYIVAGGGGGGYSGGTYGSNAGGYTNTIYASSGPWSYEYNGRFNRYGGHTQSEGNYRGGGGGYSVYTRYVMSYGHTDRPIGGTGYVFNPKTKNGVMYCYDCRLTDLPFITSRTYTIANVSENPIPKYSKRGNGYAKVTYIGEFGEEY